MPRKLTIAAVAAAVVAALAVYFFAFHTPRVTASTNPVQVASISTSFVPSQHGLAFANPVAPTNGTPVQKLTTEQCGGMAFAAIDYYRSGLKPPRSLTPTSAIVRERSVQSIVANGWRFVVWTMLPDLPAGRHVPGIGELTRREELARLERQLESGPVPVGLVRARKLSRVGLNHQVVAYALKRNKRHVTVYIYDPDQPGSNTVRLQFDLADTDGKIVERRDDWVTAEWRGLFVERYMPILPATRLVAESTE